MDNLTTVERAFALADHSACRTLGEIRAQLKKERCEAVDAHLAGAMIQRQLKARMSRRDD